MSFEIPRQCFFVFFSCFCIFVFRCSVCLPVSSFCRLWVCYYYFLLRYLQVRWLQRRHYFLILTCPILFSHPICQICLSGATAHALSSFFFFFLLLSSSLVLMVLISLLIQVHMRSGCNDYWRRKWAWWSKFETWTRLFLLHMAQIPLLKTHIQQFSLQLKSRLDWT